MHQITLAISGMSCQHCVSRIQQTLQNLAGVNDVTVNLAEQNAVINYNPLQVSPQQMVDKIDDIGYSAEIK